MTQAITMDILQMLEDKLGREEGRKVAQAIEIGLEVIEKKADAVAFQKKLELKDELIKELASKADILLVRQEMQTIKTELEGKIDVVRQEMQTIKTELDRKFTIMFIILFFTVVFLNQNALEFMAKILGVVK